MPTFLEETRMTRALMVVQARCTDPEQIKEFNEWYSFHHFPDVVESEHFTGASRYRLVGSLAGAGNGEPSDFLAIYEVDTDDAEALNKAVMDNLGVKAGEGRVLQHPSCEVISAGFYSFISEVSHVPSP